MDKDLLLGRLAYLKGYLEAIISEQNPAIQEDMQDIIFILQEDIDQLQTATITYPEPDVIN